MSVDLTFVLRNPIDTLDGRTGALVPTARAGARHIAMHPSSRTTPYDVSTSITASANACGASWGRLWPTPPVMTRCAYVPVNFSRYEAASGWGAPFASP